MYQFFIYFIFLMILYFKKLDQNIKIFKKRGTNWKVKNIRGETKSTIWVLILFYYYTIYLCLGKIKFLQH